MKGYISKYDQAIRKVKAMGYKETDFGFQNVVNQVHAKLLVGFGTTIGKDEAGKIYLAKPQ